MATGPPQDGKQPAWQAEDLATFPQLDVKQPCAPQAVDGGSWRNLETSWRVVGGWRLKGAGCVLLVEGLLVVGETDFKFLLSLFVVEVEDSMVTRSLC